MAEKKSVQACSAVSDQLDATKLIFEEQGKTA